MQWSLDMIKRGFDKFVHENGRLPRCLEVDSLNYLPSSRHIQQKFGGLVNLRKQLGYEETHFGKGLHRSNIANRTNRRGREAERCVEKILHKKFGEVFVHTEKFFDESRNRVDFFVYTPSGNFGVDVVHCDCFRTLKSNINIKINKYKNFKYPLYFVSINKYLNQEEIDLYSKMKTKSLNINCWILTSKTFIQKIEKMANYNSPF